MLRCEECRRAAAEECRGWVAYKVDEPDEPGRTFVVVYCPGCAAREFGDETDR
jgi:hypothetical protein